MIRTADIELEQELARPFAYVPMLGTPPAVHFISLKDPQKAKVVKTWWMENPELHRGLGGLSPTYLKTHGRYYVVTAIQFQQGGPDVNLAAVVTDVTSLPDTTKVKEVRRFQVPDAPGGFHDVFPYKHSDGRVIMFATSRGGGRMYDLDKFIAGDANQGYIGTVPVPVPPDAQAGGTMRAGYHDFYVAYDPANHRDVFYGPGTGETSSSSPVTG